VPRASPTRPLRSARAQRAWAHPVLWGLLLCALPGFARAHAPPEVLRIVPDAGAGLVLVSNRGLIFGAPEGGSFRLMCGEALHINSGEQPKIARRKDGGLLAATSGGLFLTHDQGCSWAPVPPLVEMFVPALLQLPGAPDSLLAATFGDGQSALRITRDGGESWELLSPLGDRDYTRSLLVAPGDPTLLYASGIELVSTPAPAQRHYTARSTDGGETWQRWEQALGEDELDLTLLAVNPQRPGELIARAGSASPGFLAERLLLSSDGGASFRSPRSLLAIASAAFSPDGETIWVAAGEGLWRAGPARDAFERVGDAERLTCVHHDPDGSLWVCGRYAGNASPHNGVGRSADASAAFEPFMDFTDVTAPVACEPDAQTTGLCASWWSDFESEVFGVFVDAGVPAALDAGGPLPDAGMVLPGAEPAAAGTGEAGVPAELDAGSAPRRSARASGCALSRRHGASASELAVLLGFVALLARRESRRRTR
jgi:hypothetical protein